MADGDQNQEVQYEDIDGKSHDLRRYHNVVDATADRKRHQDDIRRAIAGFLAEQRKSRESIVQSGFFLSGIHRAIPDSEGRKVRYKALGIDATEAKKLVAVSQVDSFSDDTLTMNLPHRLEHLWQLTKLDDGDLRIAADANLLRQNMTAWDVKELVRVKGIPGGFDVLRAIVDAHRAEGKNSLPDKITSRIRADENNQAVVLDETPKGGGSLKPKKGGAGSTLKSYLSVKVDTEKMKSEADLNRFKTDLDALVAKHVGVSASVVPTDMAKTLKRWKLGVTAETAAKAETDAALAEVAAVLKSYDTLVRDNTGDAILKSALRSVSDHSYKLVFAEQSDHKVFTLLDKHSIKPRVVKDSSDWTKDRKVWVLGA